MAERESSRRVAFPDSRTVTFENFKIILGNISANVKFQHIFQRFKRYGHIADIDIRSGFAYVQYKNANAAQLAIKNEHQRLFVGNRITVEPAKPEKLRNEKPRIDREVSTKRVKEDPLDIQSIVLCHIILLGEAIRGYGEEVKRQILNEVGSFGVELVSADSRLLEDLRQRSREDGVRYVIVAGAKNRSNRTVSLSIFPLLGPKEEHAHIPLNIMIEKILRQERLLLSTMSLLNQQQQSDGGRSNSLSAQSSSTDSTTLLSNLLAQAQPVIQPQQQQQQAQTPAADQVRDLLGSLLQNTSANTPSSSNSQTSAINTALSSLLGSNTNLSAFQSLVNNLPSTTSSYQQEQRPPVQQQPGNMDSMIAMLKQKSAFNSTDPRLHR